MLRHEHLQVGLAAGHQLGKHAVEVPGHRCERGFEPAVFALIERAHQLLNRRLPLL